LAQGSPWLAAAAYNGLAMAYTPAADYSRSLVYSQRAERLAAQLGDSYGELRSVVMSAGIQQFLGQYAECLATVRHGLELAESKSDPHKIGGLYAQMGLSLLALKQSDAALSYQQAAVNIVRPLNNSFALSRYLVYLGLIYRQRGQYAEAL
jgi:tetratricopeptide (TPR) repeat protein